MSTTIQARYLWYRQNVKITIYFLFLLLPVLMSCEDESKLDPIEIRREPDILNNVDFIEPPEGYEPIVFAIDHEMSLKVPDWKEKVKQAIDSVNKVFQKTTQKKYFVSKYMTFRWTSFIQVDHNLNYRVKYKGRGGITVKLFVRPQGFNMSNNTPLGITLSKSSHYIESVINSTHYPTVNLLEDEGFSILGYYADLGNEFYWTYLLRTLIHELGHANGLAWPDLYNYVFKDTSGVEPLLPTFDFNKMYPNDPMFGFSTGDFEEEMLQFNEFNSTFINLNLDHTYYIRDAHDLKAHTCKVRVTNQNGAPLQNAEVRIYPVKFLRINPLAPKIESDMDLTQPLQTLFTDETGKAEYQPPYFFGCSGKSQDGLGCSVRVIKVIYEGEVQSKYVKVYDLQEDFVLYGKEIHIDEFVF